MTAQFARPQQRGRSASGQAHEPHAALLIDFDNVTMGIRSDLTKELKNLLNSDIIKGKVAVQRAYADWRRYPQYIVPLAESSVDLIFAPAYGSAKKNATDIRLAIDAIELVFTRPEIGTIILLSGDSDFSSMVLKLKEYGKYVIGVGIRESASDLLVQNCDEYYSYSALTGLTRAGDETPAVSEDPWELVEMALRQMRDNDDVMRSDRLKQVLLELDPSFDEKALGFQKFNKFLQEAASRGLLSLRKQDNGQFEIGPADAAAIAETQAEARGEARRGRGRRGRGRREEARERAEPVQPAAAPAPAPVAPAVASAPLAAAAAPRAERIRTQAEPAAVEPPARPKVEAPKPDIEAIQPKPEPAKPRPEPARERVRPAPETDTERRPVAAEAAPGDVAARVKETKAADAADLAASYELLRRAASDLVRKSGQAARDSDVKRRMLELESGWDESALGFSKFSRFLRQAHDAEVITLRKGENGAYDVLPGNGETAPAREAGTEPGRERGRGRAGRLRAERERPDESARVPGRIAAAAPPPDSSAAAPQAGVRPADARNAPPTERRSEPLPPPAPTQPLSPSSQTVAPAAATPPGPAAGQKRGAAALLFRRGSRGPGAPSGPPPLLEGQTAVVRLPAAKAPATPVQPEAVPAPTAAAAAPQPERPVAEVPPGSVAIQAGLPQDPAEVLGYITTNYKGVGPKSVQTLIDEFGATRVFDALDRLPDRVRELLGPSRGDRLLAAWRADVRRHRGETAAAPVPVQPGVRKSAAKRAAKTAGPTPAKRGAAKASATAPGSTATAGAGAPTAPAPAPVQTTSPAAKSGRRGRRGSRRGKPATK